ncbi:oligosaccharide flippase family protein [Schleiferiaceae bacterium]|nr:oligosaccharide flippase family protein [Schleiferiaceae bacterium]
MKVLEKIIKNKLLFENFGYLSLLQIVLLVTPLIYYPYLIRVLGAENYGLVIFMQSIIAFFNILINFGLNIFSTKDVAINRNDINKLSEIFSIVLIIKIVLFFLGLIILLIFCNFIPFFQKNALLSFACYSISISEILFPVWFYQGIEKMKYITIINVISKIIITLSIFLIINQSRDYILFPILLSIGGFIGGLISFFLCFKVEKIVFKFIDFRTLLNYGRRSFPFFASRISAVFAIQVNSILIGSFVGLSQVAYYDLAKKLIELFKIPNSLINQTVYPKIARERNIVFVKKTFNLRLILSLILYLILVFSGEYIVNLIGGSEMLEASNLLWIFGILIPLTCITYYLGSTVLVSFNYENKFNISVLFSTLFYLIMSMCLYILDGITMTNLIYLIVITELLLALYRYYYCKKYSIL